MLESTLKTRVPLRVLCTEVRSRNLGTQRSNLLSLSYGRIIRKDITSNEGLLPENFEGYNIVNSGDTVLRLTDLQNDQRSLRTGLVRESGIITSAYLTLRPKESVEPRFFAYVLHGLDVSKVFYSLGGGLRQSIGFEELKSLSLTIPALEEQRRIADFLDDQVTLIDQLAHAKRRSIALWDEYLREQLDTQITGRSTALRHLVTSLRDGTHGSYARVDQGIPLLSVRNLQDGEFHLLEDDSCVSEADYREIRRGCPVDVGDILLAIVGATLGKSAINQIKSPFCLQRSVAVIRCRNDKIRNRWLLWALRSPDVQSQLWQAAGFSAQPGVYLNTVGGLRIPTPSLDEQDRKLRTLEETEAMTTELREFAKTQVNLLDEYKRSLISAAVQGEFDVSSASDRGMTA